MATDLMTGPDKASANNGDSSYLISFDQPIELYRLTVRCLLVVESSESTQNAQFSRVETANLRFDGEDLRKLQNAFPEEPENMLDELLYERSYGIGEYRVKEYGIVLV